MTPNDKVYLDSTIIGATARAMYFIRTTWLLFGVGAAAAFFRVGVRYYLTRTVSKEEYLVLFALISWTADTACIPFIVQNGTNAMSAAKRQAIVPGSVEWNNRIMAGKMFVGAWVAYITMIWALKASILLFYGRLTDRLQEKRIIQAAWGIVGITWLACVLSIFLVCRPFQANWQIYPDPGRQCTDGHEYVWIVGVLNILTDTMLLTIPLPIVFRVRATIGRKIMLACVFSLGIFVIIATLLRIYFTIQGGNIQNMTFWSMIETCTAMVVANCPGIRAIFVQMRASRVVNSSNASGSVQNFWEMKRSKTKLKQKDPLEVTHGHTVNIEAGDSTERIVEPVVGRRDEDVELGNERHGHGGKKVLGGEEKMVIHQRVTYEVRGHEATPEDFAEARQAHLHGSGRTKWTSIDASH